MCTVEAPIHLNVKQAIVNGDEHQTTLILRRWKNTSRMFTNQMTAKTIEIESTSTTGEFAEVAPVVSGAKGREVLVGGDIEHGVSCRPSSPVALADFRSRFGMPAK
jgi:NAD(P)H-dependent flavin oxidoreductase YrpB (nitropropane dioxygenase family)